MSVVCLIINPSLVIEPLIQESTVENTFMFTSELWYEYDCVVSEPVNHVPPLPLNEC